MKILVCIKQVMDLDLRQKPEPEGVWLRETSDTLFRMNRYDEYALEQALALKDRNPDTVIHALTVGPDRAASVIGRALSMGADEGIHLRCARPLLSAMETAGAIAAYAGQLGFDLILTGVMSEDAMQCQVGPMLAKLLTIPCAVAVTSTTLPSEESLLPVVSELEGMRSEKITVTLPALLTIQSSENRPRYPSLSNILRAKGKNLQSLEIGDPELLTPRQEFTDLDYPPRATKGVVLEGERDEKAGQLLTILHERSLLRVISTVGQGE